ncbi:MAG TPA: hypothetical protein VJP76_01475, partial [Candidatus Tumulicola sp.]|nr:hypothetical protein [Candidatus Tumulicola sp.]
MISGALGAGWLIGLWVAAPIFGRARGAARIAQAIALGCLIPLALGALNLLYAWSLWIVLAGVAIASLLRQRHGDAEPAARGEVEWDLLVGFVALVALAWPVAVRPLLDGDTLIYHLPNAASWANQHGFWTTGTRYWWYPPASEIFASGLLATGGIGAVGWAGLPPAVLLLLTFRAVARRSGTAPIVGTLVACALLATPVAVQQLVSLQNDLWLSALFIFAVTEYATPAFAVLSLTKPTGLAFALLASGAWRGTKRRIAAAVSAGAFALWGARDLILAPRPLSTIAAWLPKGGPGSTIAAHLPESLLVFARASWHEGPAWCAFSLLG